MRSTHCSPAASFSGKTLLLRFSIFFLIFLSIFTSGGCFLWGPDFTIPPRAVYDPGTEVVVPYIRPDAAVVLARINGKGPFKCLVDTGSRGCVVTKEVAKAILPAQTVRSRPRLRDGSLVPIDDWMIGNVSFRDFHAMIGDTGNVDCILGANALQLVVTAWDTPNGRLILNIDREGQSNEVAALPLDISGNRPYLEAKVNGKETDNILLAPGLPQSILSREFADELGSKGESSMDIEVALPNLSVPLSAPAAVLDEAGTGSLYSSPDLKLASDLLLNYMVVISFPSQKAYFFLRENAGTGDFMPSRIPDSEIPSGNTSQTEDLPGTPSSPSSAIESDETVSPGTVNVDSPFFGQ